ncbi:MAG TPA: hypothetical protein ENN99_02385, partial [Chloroflexi bacterium]|nr:hypothetical protein [Chloroflexota bacterium]
MTRRERRPRRKRAKPTPSGRREFRAAMAVDVEFRPAFQKAERLIEQGRAMPAVELLKPLLDTHPRNPALHYLLGYAYVSAGHAWMGLNEYERAQQLSREAEY